MWDENNNLKKSRPRLQKPGDPELEVCMKLIYGPTQHQVSSLCSLPVVFSTWPCLFSTTVLFPPVPCGAGPAYRYCPLPERM